MQLTQILSNSLKYHNLCFSLCFYLLNPYSCQYTSIMSLCWTFLWLLLDHWHRPRIRYFLKWSHHPLRNLSLFPTLQALHIFVLHSLSNLTIHLSSSSNRGQPISLYFDPTSSTLFPSNYCHSTFITFFQSDLTLPYRTLSYLTIYSKLFYLAFIPLSDLTTIVRLLVAGLRPTSPILLFYLI